MNLHIPDSYKIKGVRAIRTEVQRYYAAGALDKNRSSESYVYEWAAHNLLYSWGLFVSHTKDVDLNGDEPMWRRVIYFILYIVYGAVV